MMIKFLKLLLFILVSIECSFAAKLTEYAGFRVGGLSGLPNSNAGVNFTVTFDEQSRKYFEDGDLGTIWSACSSDWYCVDSRILTFAFRQEMIADSIQAWEFGEFKYFLKGALSQGKETIYVVDVQYKKSNWVVNTVFYSKERGVINFLHKTENEIVYYSLLNRIGLLSLNVN